MPDDLIINPIEPSDVTMFEHAQGPFSMRINRTTLSAAIPGFMVSNVDGRDALSDNISEHDYTRFDGSLYRYRKHTSKSLSVSYNLVSDDDATQRSRMTQLRSLLMGKGTENARFIFADEPDMCWYGTVSGITESKIVYNNTSTGTITIHLAKPFKYSLQGMTTSPQIVDGKSRFIVDYEGTYKSYPSFNVRFAEENVPAGYTISHVGDCGYVAFVNQDGKVLQFGNPDETDLDSTSTSETLVNQKFTIWDSQASSNWELNQASGQKVLPLSDDDFDPVGSVGKATQFSTDILTAASYGTGDKWHGPSITYEIPDDDVEDFTLSFGAVFATGGNPSTAVNIAGELGSLCVLISNDHGILAGIRFRKATKEANRGDIYLFAYGERIQKITDVDFGTYTSNYGWKKDDDSEEKNRTVRIQRRGDNLTFVVNGEEIQKMYGRYVVPDPWENAKYITIWFLGHKESYPMGSIGVTDIVFSSDHNATGNNIKNTFISNDICDVDCENATVSLNGISTPSLGAIGNQWEEFYLQPGVNQIDVNWSSWVLDANKPTVTMTYRKVYI